MKRTPKEAKLMKEVMDFLAREEMKLANERDALSGFFSAKEYARLSARIGTLRTISHGILNLFNGGK